MEKIHLCIDSIDKNVFHVYGVDYRKAGSFTIQKYVFAFSITKDTIDMIFGPDIIAELEERRETSASVETFIIDFE